MFIKLNHPAKSPGLKGQAFIALTYTTLRYALEIANNGWTGAMRKNPEIKYGANAIKGEEICRGVADSFGVATLHPAPPVKL